MANSTERPETYLRAKELSAAFGELGIVPSSYDAMLALVAQCPAAIGHTVRLSDAIEFMRTHRDFRPFRRKPSRNAAGAGAAVITLAGR